MLMNQFQNLLSKYDQKIDPNPLKSLHNFFFKNPKNVTIFLEFFLKVPLTMLLGTFLKNQNGEFLPQKRNH
jgi:hypothetical protein